MSDKDVEKAANKAWKRAREALRSEFGDLTNEQMKKARRRVSELAGKAADRAEEKLGW